MVATLNLGKRFRSGTVLLACLGSALVGLSNAEAASDAAPGFQLQGPAEQFGMSVVKDAFNRPCLDIEAIARAHVVDQEMMDHVVSIKNNCNRIISAKVCYFRSDHCVQSEIGAYRRVDLILGTLRGVKFFRYS